MKTLIAAMIVLAGFLVACNSNDDSSVASASETATVASYVSENYPDASLLSTSSSNSCLTGTLTTGEVIKLSKNGKLMAYSNASADGLCTDSLIVKDSIDHRGHHRGGHGRPAGHPRPGHPLHAVNEIAIDSLPAAINEYILSNYNDYRVIHAQTDTLCNGTVTSVFVCNSTHEPFKLVFDANGTFLMTGVRALSSSFPEAVLSAVAANYADYSLRLKGTIYTLADNSLQYRVYLKSTNSHLTVTYQADGTVVCVK